MRRRSRTLYGVHLDCVDGINWTWGVGPTMYRWSKLTHVLCLDKDPDSRAWGINGAVCLRLAVGLTLGCHLAVLPGRQSYDPKTGLFEG